MISIIVPLRNEAAKISQFERELAQLKGVYGQDFELIYVDGESSDGSRELLSYPCIQYAPGRGGQLRAGAAAARGEFLWFAHVDSRLDPHSLQLIAESKAQWGCFRLRFEPSHPVLALVAAASNWRARHRRLVFGDQGMFICRSLYEQCGGFDPLPLMEDYAFSQKLQHMGLAPKLLNAHITTSSRRFANPRTGRPSFCSSARSCLLMQRVQAAFRAGRPIEELLQLYYGGPREKSCKDSCKECCEKREMQKIRSGVARDGHV